MNNPYRHKFEIVIRFLGIAFAVYLISSLIILFLGIPVQEVHSKIPDNIQTIHFGSIDNSHYPIEKLVDSNRKVIIIDSKWLAYLTFLFTITSVIIIFNRRIGKILAPEWLIRANSLESKFPISQPMKPTKMENKT